MPFASETEGVDGFSALFEAIAGLCAAVVAVVATLPIFLETLFTGKGEMRARAYAHTLPLSRVHVRAGVVGQLNMASAAGCGACACAR